MGRYPRILLTAFALCVILLAPATAEAARGDSRLCAELRSRLVRGGGGASGLVVLDAENSRVVCRRAARRRLPLASNMKLFTTGAALGRLGPGARIPTRLMADGRVDERGILRGSLYLVGGGDPVLASPAFSERFRAGLGTNLFALARRLRSTGVRGVTGRLYADDTIFDRLRGVRDSGYATSPYIGPLSGLAFNSGFSSSSGLRFASDPARIAARKLARSMRRAGIRMRAHVALGAAPRGAETLTSVRSPQLKQIAAATNVPSNNYYAEMLIKLLGARVGSAGTTAAGAAVVSRFAREVGTGVAAVDGSGLTRSNRASAAQVARFLEGMWRHEAGEDFVETLAVAGRDGTVATRMRGSAAAGRCRVKTGTLTGVSSLSGYCSNRGGGAMIFSILMASVYDLGRAHHEQDRIAAAVAGY